MKNFFLVMVSCLLLLPLSCGGGSSSSGGNSSNNGGNYDVFLSGLNITPSQASLNQGGGNINVSMIFSFVEVKSTVSTVTLFYTDPNGKTTTYNPVGTNVGGQGIGQITIQYIQPTTIRGNWMVGVFVTDANSQNSNQITATFTIS